MIYEQVFINGKGENLPKISGQYFVNRSGLMSIMDFYINKSEMMWLKEVRWWVKPLPEPAQGMPTDEDVMLYFANYCKNSREMRVNYQDFTRGLVLEFAKWFKSRLTPSKEELRKDEVIVSVRYIQKFVMPNKKYPVTYIIDEHGNKINRLTRLKGKELTENQIKELFKAELI